MSKITRIAYILRTPNNYMMHHHFIITLISDASTGLFPITLLTVVLAFSTDAPVPIRLSKYDQEVVIYISERKKNLMRLYMWWCVRKT